MSTFSPGGRIGPYEIDAKIGAGGMGEVYRARDLRLHRTVAIKILPANATADAGARERFEREARAIAAVSHPHICVLHDVGVDQGVEFLVMEHLPGETLATKLAKGALAPQQVLRYAIQITGAVAAAHDAGILHRDIKPSNVIVSQDGHVKVLDFGLAKLLPRHTATTRTGLTEAGLVLGTVAYMAPEQARGELADVRSDLFSLGAVFYELATGRPAFPRPFDWSLPSRQGLPRHLRPIVFKLLNSRPEQRYQTAATLLADLQRIQAQTAGSGSPFIGRVAVGAAILGISAAGVVWWMQSALDPPVAGDTRGWTRLTSFADSVSQPALSRDGRLLAFIRGSDTFVGAPGEIFVKQLPDGEPVQLTHDGTRKTGPAFSPDATRLAFTVNVGTAWDTWVIPMPGGQPRPWLLNASGLVWGSGPERHLIFAEIKNHDMHMGIVMADESRANARDLYIPPSDRDMAHRAYPSPDGKSLLIVEMARGDWQPCRLIRMEGGWVSRQVGPPGAECTAAGWSLDGRWMYLNTNDEGSFQIVRQRFPDGPIDHVTTGPTEAEGFAIAPDGHSFVTAIAQRQSALVLHQASAERQVSAEGYAFDPRFTADGRQIVYRVLRKGTPISGPSSLRVMDVESGHDEALMPELSFVGRTALSYDLSPDGRQVALAEADHRNGPMWIVPLDRASPPARIPNVMGSRPVFGSGAEVFFDVVNEGGPSSTIYAVRTDGTGRRRVLEREVIGLRGITADREWLIVRAREGDDTCMLAVPVRGGVPTCLARGDVNDFQWKWSPDGRTLVLSGPSPGAAVGHSYIVPLPRDRMFPDLPARGFTREAELAGLPGVRQVPALDVSFGSDGNYAYSRVSVLRNLYRIPLR